MAATRRLAAIMFTDIVGYTALAQKDEASALKLLDRHSRLLRPIFPLFHGKEIKAIGDSFLVEFKSALDATNCAIEIQRLLNEDSVSAPEESRVRVRIGIHVGDVVHRSGDVFGDSVNIASRMEPMAEPGGICISQQVFDQVRNKIPNQLEKLEPKTLKNVQFLMDIYRVVLPWTVREVQSAASAATGLAVLPFANISPDPNDEYFADGLTEELITVLSQLPGLRVIARTSVMQYKSTTKAISQIGTDLNVASVLEGSVRKAGNRLRITAQMIDVESQGHVWAQTYERELDDVFAVQAQLAKQVADGLKIKLRTTEEARLGARPPVRPDSYLAYLKGRTLMHDTLEASLTAAKKQFELAISLDESNAAAHSGLADVTLMAGWFYADVPHAAWDATGRRLAARAIELDPNLAEAHTTLALVRWQDFDYASAEREFKVALSLNPSYSLAHFHYGIMLEDQARGDDALQQLMLAEAADPLWGNALYFLARHLLWLGRYDEALLRVRGFGELNPSGAEHHFLLASYHRARSQRDLCLEEIKRAEEAEADPKVRPIRAAEVFALAGEKERARALLKEAELRRESPPDPVNIANIYGLLGDLDDCFFWLDKNSHTHNHPFQMFQLSPDLESVRRDPRFQGVLRKMKLL